MVHLHGRDEITVWQRIRLPFMKGLLPGIRSFSKDLIICVSLSGRNVQTFEHRSEVLQLDGK